MTVAELIAKLGSIKPDRVVVVFDADVQDCCEVTQLTVDETAVVIS